MWNFRRREEDFSLSFLPRRVVDDEWGWDGARAVSPRLSEEERGGTAVPQFEKEKVL